jgi:TonB family protein
MRQEKVAKAYTQFSAKSPANIEANPQSAKRLQIASIQLQAVSRQIQASTPKTIQSHKALKMSIANSKPGPIKEIAHVQVKTPHANSIEEIVKTAQAVHQASKSVSARKEIQQRSREEISLASYHPTAIMSSKPSASVAPSSLRHPAKQFHFLSTEKESAVSPQQTSGDISIKLTRLFPAELRSQQNVIQGKPAEEIHPAAPSSVALNPAQEHHSNPLPGEDLEPSAPLNREENPSYFPGNDSGEIHRVFSAKIWGKIAEQKYYPRIARRRGYQGKPVVSFTIGKTGDLQDLVLLKASSHKILDDAALMAVKNASPYPRIPESLQLQSMQFKLPITFILDGP